MQKKLMSIFGIAVFIVIGVVLIKNVTTTETEVKQYQVAATIFPIYDIAKNIAGESINVSLVLPAGASPHTFDPSPSTLRDLVNAEILYAVGHEVDDWSTIISDSIKLDVKLVDQDIEFLYTEPLGNIDPHYWLNINNAITIANTIAADLSLRFPEHKDVFESNLENYTTELTLTNEKVKTILADSNYRIVTLHDSFGYFADAYGIEIIGTFEPTAGREPTPQYLVELIGAIKESNTKILFADPQTSTSILEGFIADNNLSIAILDPIGGEDKQNSYINLIIYNAETLSQNK